MTRDIFVIHPDLLSPLWILDAEFRGLYLQVAGIIR